MPKSILAYGINPKILKWARESSGISLELMATRLKSSVETFKNFENGTKQLTINQLYKLANYYKRAVAIFYLKKVPEGIILPDLRTIKYDPKSIKNISNSMNYQIRNILTKKKKMIYLSDVVGFKPDYSFLNDIDLSDNYTNIAKRIRKIFSIDTNEYKSLKDNDVLKYWRKKIEDRNILVFQFPFIDLKVSRGFALSSLPYPTIGLNQKDLHYSRIFTLIHELLHIFYHENGICDTLLLSDQNLDIEIKCNKIAAEVLLPTEEFTDFVSTISELSWKEKINQISKTFKVSYSVGVFRLRNLNLIPSNVFDSIYDWIITRDTPSRRKQDGGNYYFREFNSTSNLFLNVLMDAFDDNRINYSEALRITGYKTKTFDEIHKRVIFGEI